ncbi:MAG: amidohydrolase family protein [Bacillota bacterium]|nr:amidohydrolase family protein [Bacillota bacterium]
MKKKGMVLFLAFVLVLAAFTGCGGGGDEGEGTETEGTAAATVLTNGVIYTVEGDDWDQNAAQAMAVGEDGTILFVGSDEDAQAYIGDATEVVDLAGNTVLPGLIDSHNHPIGTALTELFEINLYYDFDREGSLATITSFVEENPDLDIYWGNGFNMGMVDAEGNPPNKTWIDEITDKPMVLISNDGHNTWLNTPALALFGIDASTPTPTGGNIHKDANGEPTGLLTDCGELITLSHEYTEEQLAEGTAWYLNVMREWGYTAISSAGVLDTGVNPYIFEELEDAGELTLRINYSYMMDPADYQAGLDTLDTWKAEIDSELMDITTAKFFADGVIEGVTGYLLEPYAEAAGMGSDYVSEPLWTEDVFKEAMVATLEKGYQIHVHSIGDAATRLTLDCIEYAQETVGEGDYRNVIAHLQLVDEADKPRFGELGIIANLQPFWHMKEPDWYTYVDELVLGAERAWTEYPVKSLMDNGAILTSSGDYPVSPTNDPFWAIESGLTRNLNNAEYYGVEDITDIDDPTWLLNPDERVDVKTMVEAYTINGAYQMFKDDQIGSLAVGKFADFIVIDQDIMQANPLDVDGTNVLATVLNGAVIYGGYQF